MFINKYILLKCYYQNLFNLIVFSFNNILIIKLGLLFEKNKLLFKGFLDIFFDDCFVSAVV